MYRKIRVYNIINDQNGSTTINISDSIVHISTCTYLDSLFVIITVRSNIATVLYDQGLTIGQEVICESIHINVYIHVTVHALKGLIVIAKSSLTCSPPQYPFAWLGLKLTLYTIYGAPRPSKYF